MQQEINQLLEKLNFDTHIDGNIVSATQITANKSIELFIDAANSCRVKITTQQPSNNALLEYKTIKATIIKSTQEIQQVRFSFTSLEELEGVLHTLL